MEALKNNQLPTYPGLSAKDVKKTLQLSPKNDKRHMKRTQQGIRSTRPPETKETTTQEI